MVQRILTSGRPAAARALGQRQPPVRTLTRLAEDEWAAYQAHPWLVVVLASSRPPLVPAVLDAARACTEAFMALGADPPSALGRYLALSGYVQGMALLLLAEHDESTRSGTDYRTWWTAEVRRLDRSGARRRHPWLDQVSGGPAGTDRDGDPDRDRDASPDLVPVPGPARRGFPQSFDADTDAWFRDGLERVITGLTTG